MTDDIIFDAIFDIIFKFELIVVYCINIAHGLNELLGCKSGALKCNV